MIVDRAASKRTRRNSPGSLAVLLPGLREPVPAPESEVPKGNPLEEQLLLRGAADLTRGVSAQPVFLQACLRCTWLAQVLLTSLPPLPSCPPRLA